MPVLFRLLYCCGLRVSEVTNLLGADVNLTDGILIIRESKFDKSRYVPISSELLVLCSNYDRTRLRNKSPEEDWFFAAPDGGKYSPRSIYNVFRSCLSEAGIPYRGRGKGPRLHDFRHTFAVHCLQNIVNTGADPTTALPLLRTYMGHTSFLATEGYLRMTAEAYPQILGRLERETGYIIPTLEADNS